MTLNLFSQFATPWLMGIPLSLLAMLLPALLMPLTQRFYSNRLTTLQAWLLTSFTKQLMTPINKPGHVWAALLALIMSYLLFTNLLGLLPYTFTPTTQLALNMALAGPLWLTTVIMGLRTNPTSCLAHLLPSGSPLPLIPILIIIETISLFIRPLALGVRLTANLTAGHLLITLISAAASTILTLSPTVSFLTTILLALLTGLEVAVAMIQAYVFVLLLSLYLQENT